MIHVSTAEKNFAENTFFVSTFLDKYNPSSANPLNCGIYPL